MKRRVYVYRAEEGAQDIFGPQSSPGLTPPERRKPIDTFTMAEPDVDKARQLANDFVEKRHGERGGVAVLTDGSISITLAPSRS